jgi:hypothetical protein
MKQTIGALANSFRLQNIVCLVLFGLAISAVPTNPAQGASPVIVEKIEIDRDLRLTKKFDYSTYYGAISSQEELSELWSKLVNTKRDFEILGRLEVPPPPSVDFDTHAVLWFADRGADASFVESLTIEPDATGSSLKAIITVFHSDFGSRRLNLWKIPRLEKKIEFEVKHKYESRGP